MKLTKDTPVIPTEAEAIAYFYNKGIKDEYQAVKWYRYNESRNWLDASGKQIKYWRSWADRKIEDITKYNSSHSTQNTRTASQPASTQEELTAKKNDLCIILDGYEKLYAYHTGKTPYENYRKQVKELLLQVKKQKGFKDEIELSRFISSIEVTAYDLNTLKDAYLN